jgi:hypothetical protein
MVAPDFYQIKKVANELGFELNRHHIPYHYDFKQVVYSQLYKDHYHAVYVSINHELTLQA